MIKWKFWFKNIFFYSMSKLMFTSKRSWGQRKGAGPNVPRKGPSGHWRKKGPLGHQRRTGPLERLTVRWLAKSSGMYGVLKQTLTTNSRPGMKTLNIGHVSIICIFIKQWNLSNPTPALPVTVLFDADFYSHLTIFYSFTLYTIQHCPFQQKKSSLPVHVRLDSTIIYFFFFFLYYICSCFIWTLYSPCIQLRPLLHLIDFLYLLHAHGRSRSLF